MEGGGGGVRRNVMSKLTRREMESLTAISDTLLPSLDLNGQGYCSTAARTYYGTSASMLGTPQTVDEFVACGRFEYHPLLWLLRLALWLLSTWFGTFVLCGTASLSTRFPFFRRLSNVEPHQRERIFTSWSASPFLLLRQLAKAIKVLVLYFYFTQVDEKERNPAWAALDYCGPDPDFVRSKGLDHADRVLGPLHEALVDMDSPIVALSAALARSGIALTTPGPTPSIRATIQCDAVVVGSGSGGGVLAGVLAQSGYKVVVVEKGGYHSRGGLSLLEGPSLERMYEGGGLLATNDMAVVILSGSTVGGGSAINWSASLRTPKHVMSEWREEHGLELFGSDAYDQALDVVCARMGVQPDVGAVESLSNAALRCGCAELGYPVRDIPRNAPPDHYCGWCCFGCRDGRKKGTAETWLVDMAESGNGVLLPGCRALKVLLREEGLGRRRKAAGLLFEYESRRTGRKETCVVESKVTVVACGALGTPVLLKRSGLKNPNIGRNLHLHPVVMVWGYFPESNKAAPAGKRSYEGGIMTAMSTVPSTNGDGYGAVIQTPALHPGFYSVVMPWVSAADFRDRMTRFARTAHVFALARDRGSGTVDVSGSIAYKLDARDEEVLKRGVERMLRIMSAAGAAEVGTHHAAGERLDVRRASVRELEGFVQRAARRGLRDLSTPLCSAHQMGSCRMGVRPETSAVDARGESWEVEGLFVADSSVFPTALGVNPMVTVQAISYCTAHSVLDALRRKMKLVNNYNTITNTYKGIKGAINTSK